AQAVRQDVPSDSEPRLEFLEMPKAIEGTPKDQERPLLTDQLDGRGQRARQSRLLERVDTRRQRVSRHKPFSPLVNLMKAQFGSKRQLPSETCRAIPLHITTFLQGVLAMVRSFVAVSAL